MSKAIVGRAIRMKLKISLTQLLLVVALMLMAAGCGEVQGENYKPVPTSASKTVVYIYRPWHFLGSGNSPMVTCGHDSIELEAGGYHTFYSEAGPITCTAEGAVSPLQFTAESDAAYYVREEYGSNGQIRLAVVDTDVAKGEIKLCRLQSVAQAPKAQ